MIKFILFQRSPDAPNMENDVFAHGTRKFVGARKMGRDARKRGRDRRWESREWSARFLLPDDTYI